MTTLVASAEATIHAPVDVVLDVLRDYRTHHPRILPPAFSDFTVESGGYGAGTVASFTLKLGGRTSRHRSTIDEPADGVIRERVEGRDMTTLFTVTIGAQPGTSTTHIETTWTPEGGVSGVLEKALLPGVLEKLYRDELGRLDAYASSLVVAA